MFTELPSKIRKLRRLPGLFAQEFERHRLHRNNSDHGFMQERGANNVWSEPHTNKGIELTSGLELSRHLTYPSPFIVDTHTEIPEKERRVSLKRVKSVMETNWDPDREYNRLDQRVAKSLKAVAKKRIKPGSPLNRVEIDAVHLPFILKGDRDGEFIEKVWLLHAIDSETSMPTAKKTHAFGWPK
jgi:hypothetical protein